MSCNKLFITYISLKLYLKNLLTLSIVFSSSGTGKLGSEPWKLNNWGFRLTISLMIDCKYKIRNYSKIIKIQFYTKEIKM